MKLEHQNKHEETFLNTDELSEFLKRSPGAIRNLVLRRKIPFRKPGGRLMFIKSEIERWIDTADGCRLEDIG